MKLLSTIAILSATISLTSADLLPGLKYSPPVASDVKERIAPPAESSHLYEVYFAKGNRIFQCNPEKADPQHWYKVQTHAFLYATNGQHAPFDREGNEVGQMFVAPMNTEQQKSNPVHTTPLIYNFRDGSWVGTTKPLATTKEEKGRIERGDEFNLDDHIAPVTNTSIDGYLSHATYVTRLNTLEGLAPASELCTTKGLVINKPFSAYFLFYTNDEGKKKLAEEGAIWEQMVADYTPEKLALAKPAVPVPVAAPVAEAPKSKAKAPSHYE
ncbi:hypothetical protein BD770DRAFT_326854 [Pilaira anomala]|nr:hypothetical protein BD770DRAFT_326854 [Pilaira anomala]